MSSFMRHGDYVARIDYDPDSGRFGGEVVNAADVITFHGTSVQELEREFAASVRAHLAFCKRKKIAPARPFSGTFNLRVGPDVHARVSAAASVAGESMNAWVANTLDRAARKTLGETG